MKTNVLFYLGEVLLNNLFVVFTSDHIFVDQRDHFHLPVENLFVGLWQMLAVFKDIVSCFQTDYFLLDNVSLLEYILMSFPDLRLFHGLLDGGHGDNFGLDWRRRKVVVSFLLLFNGKACAVYHIFEPLEQDRGALRVFQFLEVLHRALLNQEVFRFASFFHQFLILFGINFFCLDQVNDLLLLLEEFLEEFFVILVIPH
jgi:hypothetical protein